MAAPLTMAAAACLAGACNVSSGESSLGKAAALGLGIFLAIARGKRKSKETAVNEHKPEINIRPTGNDTFLRDFSLATLSPEDFMVMTDRLEELGDQLRAQWVRLGLQYAPLAERWERHEKGIERIEEKSLEAFSKEYESVKASIEEIRAKINQGIRENYQFGKTGFLNYDFDSKRGFVLKIGGGIEFTEQSFGRLLRAGYALPLSALEIIGRFEKHEWLLSRANLRQLTGLRELALDFRHKGRGRLADRRITNLRELLGNLAAPLISLDLKDSGLGATEAKIIAEAETLAHLEILELGANRLSGARAEPLASSPHLRKVRYLGLSGNGVGPGMVKAIVEGETFANLEELRLGMGNLGVEGANILAAWSPRKLQRLVVPRAGFTRKGVEILLASKTLGRNLRELLIWSNADFTDEERQEITRKMGENFPHLEEFRFF